MCCKGLASGSLFQIITRRFQIVATPPVRDASFAALPEQGFSAVKESYSYSNRWLYCNRCIQGSVLCLYLWRFDLSRKESRWLSRSMSSQGPTDTLPSWITSQHASDTFSFCLCEFDSLKHSSSRQLGSVGSQCGTFGKGRALGSDEY